MQRFLPAVCLLAVAAGGRAASPDEQFEKVVRPLLVAKCVGCHGEAKQKGGLRLDSLAAMVEGGESGPAVVPGKPEQSLVVTAVRHSEQLKMPPKEKLPAADVAALAAWVKAGAVWPDAKPVSAAPAKPAAVRTLTDEEKRFWAFQPVRRPEVPAARGNGSNPIDAFLAAGRRAKGLSPAPAADRRTLVRRLTLDLTGLPPTAAEVEAFEADPSPDAWDRLIDRLLASPAYGEKWGRRWLDVARYADSNGMDENLAHGNAWRYRDYVVKSFNADKPFDQFVREQIAGDLLPGGTPAERADRLTATGFLVVGPKMLAEDDPVKMRMDIIDEQLDTLGQAFLGLTVGCARCHDHKFDPLTQADYYALAGVLYSTKTMRSYGVVAQWHERPVGPADAVRLAEFETRRAAAGDAAKAAEGRLRDAVAARLTDERTRAALYAEAGRQVARRRDPLRLVVADPSKGGVKGGVLVEAEDYARGNALKLADGYGTGIGVIINGGTLPNVAEYDVEVPADGTYQVALRYAAQTSRPVVLSVGGKAVRSDAAGEATGSWNPDGQKWFAEAVVPLTRGKTTVRLECAGPFPHFDKLALLPLSKEQAAAVGPTAEQVAKEQNLLLPLVRAWAKAAEKWTDNPPAADELTKLVADANGPFKRTPELDAAVDAALAAEVKKAKDELAAVEKAKPAADEAMAVEDDARPQNVRVHLRGNHLTLGAEVPRRFPVVLAGDRQPPITAGSGRLELADWVASKDNPLTARVMANRVWLGHFGTGLVRTPDNFGRLGERPTHPELLDYLASELVASGWSVKHLHRLIVGSAAYRMGTGYDAAAFRTDPDNRSYWRFNRRRMDAEELRDGMLAVAGVLDRTPGGTLLGTKNRAYVNTTGGRGAVDFTSPRRSVYLPVVRSGLFDAFQANDFPDPSTPAGVRTQTTVPAQALFHLNSAVADQASEAFARSLLGLPGDNAMRVREAYRRVYARPPTAAEADRVLTFLAASDVPADAKKLKAWQGLCRVLLASAEFAFVE